VEIIVTDLTRFSNPDRVCLAGIEPATMACVRPVPYLTKKRCLDAGLWPGSRLRLEDVNFAGEPGPHVEDCTCSRVRSLGPASSVYFKSLLQASASFSVASGFGRPIDKRCIARDTPPLRSIITIAAVPRSVSVFEGNRKEKSLRVRFSDAAGGYYSDIPVTDLALYEIPCSRGMTDVANQLTDFLNRQADVYLRIGIGRLWKNNYWLQANGIYSFPNNLRQGRALTP